MSETNVRKCESKTKENKDYVTTSNRWQLLKATEGLDCRLVLEKFGLQSKIDWPVNGWDESRIAFVSHESFPFLSSPFMHFGSTSCEDIRLPKCPTEGWMKGEERRFVIQTIKETRRLVFEEHDWLKTNRLTSPPTFGWLWSGSRFCMIFDQRLSYNRNQDIGWPKVKMMDSSSPVDRRSSLMIWWTNPSSNVLAGCYLHDTRD